MHAKRAPEADNRMHDRRAAGAALELSTKLLSIFSLSKGSESK